MRTSLKLVRNMTTALVAGGLIMGSASELRAQAKRHIQEFDWVRGGNGAKKRNLTVAEVPKVKGDAEAHAAVTDAIAAWNAAGVGWMFTHQQDTTGAQVIISGAQDKADWPWPRSRRGRTKYMFSADRKPHNLKKCYIQLNLARIKPFNLQSTATHELGHCILIRHLQAKADVMRGPRPNCNMAKIPSDADKAAARSTSGGATQYPRGGHGKQNMSFRTSPLGFLIPNNFTQTFTLQPGPGVETTLSLPNGETVAVPILGGSMVCNFAPMPDPTDQCEPSRYVTVQSYSLTLGSFVLDGRNTGTNTVSLDHSVVSDGIVLLDSTVVNPTIPGEMDLDIFATLTNKHVSLSDPITVSTEFQGLWRVDLGAMSTFWEDDSYLFPGPLVPAVTAPGMVLLGFLLLASALILLYRRRRLVR